MQNEDQGEFCHWFHLRLSAVPLLFFLAALAAWRFILRRRVGSNAALGKELREDAPGVADHPGRFAATPPRQGGEVRFDDEIGRASCRERV